jgi:hypothetical protein
MKCTAIWVGALVFGIGTLGAAGAGEPAAEEKAAIFKAAGFTKKGDKYVRCDDTTSSSMPGFLEMADLNGDGKEEAFVRESSTFCYGNTAEAFVLVAKDDKGAWTVLLDEVGMALVLETKSKSGWKDIEVGGPGAGPFPHYRHNGKTYAKKK